MKKILLVCAIVLTLGTIGIVAQVLFAPATFAGDPAPNP